MDVDEAVVLSVEMREESWDAKERVVLEEISCVVDFFFGRGTP